MFLFSFIICRSSLTAFANFLRRWWWRSSGLPTFASCRPSSPSTSSSGFGSSSSSIPPGREIRKTPSWCRTSSFRFVFSFLETSFFLFSFWYWIKPQCPTIFKYFWHCLNFTQVKCHLTYVCFAVTLFFSILPIFFCCFFPFDLFIVNTLRVNFINFCVSFGKQYYLYLFRSESKRPEHFFSNLPRVCHTSKSSKSSGSTIWSIITWTWTCCWRVSPFAISTLV